MPAASEPTPGEPAASPAADLPRTWRPLGTTIAGIFASATVLAAMVAAWVLLDAEVREHFNWLQRVTMGVLIAASGAVLWGIMRCRVTASVTGLEVVNGYRRYTYEWAQVVAIRLPQGAPWAVLDLTDGTSRPVIGLQSVDGARAYGGVRAIRALVDHPPTPS